jgi:signal transduction histidine kinase
MSESNLATSSFPVSPPRVRVEWLIAGVRVAIAVSALLAFLIDVPNYFPPYIVSLVFVVYLIYGVAVLALVWSPVNFGRGWDLAVHLFDLLVFVLAASMIDVVPSPFFASFAFIVVSASLRWRDKGTVITVVAALVAYSIVAIYGMPFLPEPAFQVNVFFIRIVYLVTMAVLLGNFGALQQRSHSEVVGLASWPRRVSRDPREVVSEVLFQSAKLVDAPRVVLIWEDPVESRVNIAWLAHDELRWVQEPEGTYGTLVRPPYERAIIQASDASIDEGSVVAFTDGGFRYRNDRPLNELLRARFNMTAVQAWPLSGELIQGRLFALDKERMQIDDLVMGELVARLAVSRLDSLYLIERMQDAAALETRVRVARELHDGLLQAHTGAALQLLVARRLLDNDPVAGRVRLEEVQRMLERGELDMRTFIRRLRPEEEKKATAGYSTLGDRLEVLKRRIAREWDVKVVLRAQGADLLPAGISEDVYRLAQEGALNAARHADPSVIKIDLTVEEDKLRLGIADDGQGFPLQGTYDLAALNAINQGPLTLRERVAALRGDLMLRSNETGTQILITLPLVAVVA